MSLAALLQQVARRMPAALCKRLVQAGADCQQAAAQGDAVAYAIFNLQDRGPMFIEHGTKVYAGMIIGEHTRGNDLELNVIKGKKLTNVRASGKDEAVVLTPPIRMSLEKALAYVGEDELVEVTPKSIRLRKAILDPNERKKVSRQKEAASEA